MYELLEQLERWRTSAHIFSGDEIARMKEVELTSDLVLAMLRGLGASRRGSTARTGTLTIGFPDSGSSNKTVPEGDGRNRRNSR